MLCSSVHGLAPGFFCTRRCVLAVHKQTKTQQMQRAHLMLMSGRREHVLLPLLAVLGSRWKGGNP